MTLEYSTTRSMLWRWYWRNLFRGGAHRTLWLVWMAVSFFVGFWKSHLAGDPPTWSVVVGLGASLCMAALLAAYPQLRFKPQSRALTLFPNELSTTIRGQTKKYSWRDVARFEEDGPFVIIGLRNLNAFIVPPTAFRDESQRKAMIEQGRTWWRNALASSGG